jgi:hypothetical protein
MRRESAGHSIGVSLVHTATDYSRSPTRFANASKVQQLLK